MAEGDFKALLDEVAHGERIPVHVPARKPLVRHVEERKQALLLDNFANFFPLLFLEEENDGKMKSQLDFQVENQPRAAFVPIHQYPRQKMPEGGGG